MTKFSARGLTSCLPICRSEVRSLVLHKDRNTYLFEDVTNSGTSEPVNNVWIVPGHIFVSLRNSTKLITFDCKPVIYHHDIGMSTLDFRALKPAVLEIFVSPITPGIVYIVQQNGHVHCWQFSTTFQWSSVLEFDLCENAHSEVISICLHPKLNTFYWCEHGGSTYSIYSKSLPDSFQDTQKKKQEASFVIVQDCPASDLLPLDNGLLIVPRYKENQTRMCIFWRPSVLELVSIATIVGSTVRDQHDMRSPLTFSEVLLNCLSDLSQVSFSVADLGAKKDCVTGHVLLLHSDGVVQSFRVADSKQRSDIEAEQSVAVDSMKIPMPEQLLQTDKASDAWSVHKNIIALVTGTSTVRLYSAAEGNLMHELEMEQGVTILKLACVRSPTILAAMVTSSGVTVVQGGKIVSRTASEHHGLPGDKHFQTDALQVALLTQQREENPGQHISDQLWALHKKWTDLQGHQPRSQLSETVDAYLAEFWSLEEQARHLWKSQLNLLPSVHGTREMVQETVKKSRAMAPEASAAELMWLSQKYPTDMLQVLLGDLDVEKEELSTEEQVMWQSTLGLENADGHLHLQYSTITFELVCRLLYQQRPQALVPFVRNAQAVREQAVGVSAFVRKKHMLQYYMRALECLPEPNNSRHPEKAACAKAQIILLGASDQGPELALRFLLRHNQWSEAIRLLQQVGTNTPQHTSLFFLLLQHLLQGQALPDYASEVFSLLPSWKSFLPALKVMGDCSSAQSAASLPGPFYSGPPDIPLSALQPCLMSFLSADRK